MRWLVLVVMVAGCTRNPAVCCQTPEQCTTLGLDMMYGCEGEKVCTLDGACVDPQCTTAADCTSPDAPLREQGLRRFVSVESGLRVRARCDLRQGDGRVPRVRAR